MSGLKHIDDIASGNCATSVVSFEKFVSETLLTSADEDALLDPRAAICDALWVKRHSVGVQRVDANGVSAVLFLQQQCIGNGLRFGRRGFGR